MGLDISLGTDIKEIYRKEYERNQKSDYFKQHSLSRTFCNFMCRQFSSTGEPELDQIGRITSVDISPLYEMETYRHEEDKWYKDDLERILLQEERLKNNENLQGNIDTIYFTISTLIEKLATIDNLHQLLNDNSYDTLGYATYFTDFNVDKGDVYIDNNFGQDLRNFKRFLEFAKERGASTVYFEYG
jgi:hypothetical protein